LLQKRYGQVGVKYENGQKYIVMVSTQTGEAVEVARVPLKKKKVYLKAECDFNNQADVATFYYSLDNKTWNPIGNTLKMTYDLKHFMGYRFALFNYGTKTVGGIADFDYFHITDTITAKN
jgi:beta-xylosidase